MDGFRAPVRERIYLAEQPRFWTKSHGAEWKGPETMKLGPGGTLSLGPKTTREDSDTTQEGPALDSKDMISDITMGGPLNQTRVLRTVQEASCTGHGCYTFFRPI